MQLTLLRWAPYVSNVNIMRGRRSLAYSRTHARTLLRKKSLKFKGT